MNALRRLLPLALAVITAMPALACKSARSDGARATEVDAPPALPQLVVRDNSEGLTFSYITLDGGFQLVKKVSDVPYEARDAVRVWSEQSGDGIAGPWVYVADLRNHLADGTYKVDVLARTAFEQLAEDRRKKKGGPAVAKSDKDKGPTPNKDDPPPAANGKLKVIIYGADWCKPCHLAEAYLKKKGIPFEHKDIDEPENNEEMRIKLQEAGIKSHSIPVLDVGGKLLIGFSESELDKAISAAGG
jgi:glutaredoxin